jgi:hypothetical protein
VKLWLSSVTCRSTDKYLAVPFLFWATNKDEANGHALACMEKINPRSEGWFDYSAVSNEVPESFFDEVKRNRGW